MERSYFFAHVPISFLIFAALSACSPSTSNDTTNTAQAPHPQNSGPPGATGIDANAKDVAAVQSYYAKREIGGGWSINTISAKGKDVVATLQLSSDEQACAFKEDSLERRELAFSIACPYAGDYIWSQLNSDQDVILEVSCSGSVYHTQHCRESGRSGSVLPTP